MIAHAAPGDTVVIDAGVDPSLTHGEIAMAENLTIEGQGARSTTINANGDSRIFGINFNGGSGTVSISGLTLTGGVASDTNTSEGDSYGGGAVAIEGGNVSLADVQLSGNQATATSSNAPYEQTQGGALLQRGGTLTLDRVTISGNTSSNTGDEGGATGGGLVLLGTATIVDSTIADNTVSEPNSGRQSVREAGSRPTSVRM